MIYQPTNQHHVVCLTLLGNTDDATIIRSQPFVFLYVVMNHACTSSRHLANPDHENAVLLYPDLIGCDLEGGVTYETRDRS